MSLQINTHVASAKALNNISRANNLLNSAVNGLSGGMRSSAPGDDAGAFGMAESFFQSVSASRKKPSIRDHPKTAVGTDKILASAGGLARMESLLSSMAAAQPINPESARDSAVSALLSISGNAILAMDAQANQRSDAVLKLLE